MDELLRVEDLHLWVQTEKGLEHILDGAHISLRPGEIHGLIGESGCGKTMMTKTILNLGDRERMVVRGSIQYRGQELLDMPPDRRRALGGREIGYITQDPLTALHPLFRVGEQIAEMLRYHRGMSRREALHEAAIQLERVGIHPGREMARRYPHQFSGGQLQRICLAMAVCCEPGLIIADEPTTALDVTTQAQILELLRGLGEQGMGVLLITHDFGVVAELCQQVSVMERGRIIEEGSMQQLLDEPKKEYTRRLIESALRKERAYE